MKRWATLGQNDELTRQLREENEREHQQEKTRFSKLLKETSENFHKCTLAFSRGF
jgi:hypothetical protein